VSPEQPGGAPETESPAVIVPAPAEAPGDGADPRQAITEPDKVLRIATMVRELLDETRQAPPDERGRAMLRDVYGKAVDELSEVLSDDLKSELETLAPSMETVPTESEIRVAQALLVGWLEGLFHGIQAAVYAQQMAARAQFDELRRRGLPPGMQGGIPDGIPGGPSRERPQPDQGSSGTYL
jgi:Bacterial proteasome activator